MRKSLVLVAWVLWSVGMPATITSEGKSYLQMGSIALDWFDLRRECEVARQREERVMGPLVCLPAGLDPEKTKLYRFPPR